MMLGDPGVLLSIEHTVYPCMNVKTREKGCFGRMRVKWGGGVLGGKIRKKGAPLSVKLVFNTVYFLANQDLWYLYK